MVTRRDILALAAALPFTIPRFDVSDWAENTNSGLHEPTDLGISDLMPLISHGPYDRYAWLDLPEGEQLPVVRGMFWVVIRTMYAPGPISMGANFGDGWRNHEVIPEENLAPYPELIEQEAVMRAIRLLIRTHAGVETRFLDI